MATNRRLFVGNLHEDVQNKDLESRFSSFGNVRNVEIRSKNEAVFAFVDVEFQDEAATRKCVDVLNNTKWKGLVLKVQIAKENFLDKLKRERGEVDPREYRTQNRPKYEKPALPDNFDFEIVSKGKGQGCGKTLLNPSYLASNVREKNKLHAPDDTRHNHSQLKDPALVPKKCDSSTSPEKVEFRNHSAAKEKRLPPKRVLSDPDSSGVSSEEEAEHDGIPRFRGFGFYPGLIRPPSPVKDCLPVPEPTPRNTEPPVPEPVPPKEKFGLKLNPRKKAKSDQLRLQSLDSRQRLQESRSSLIHQALSKIDAEPVTFAQNEKVSKESTDFLFGNDNEDEDESLSLKIKPQYEGEMGQKMLQLKSTFGLDSRFQMDERFAEKSGEGKGQEESEKASQLDILGQILGPMDSKLSSKSKLQDKTQSFKYIRYDPTVEEHKKFQKAKVETKEKPLKANKKEKDIMKAAEDKVRIEEEMKKLRDPSAKSTFKVAPNLKSLFSSEPSGSKGFSLLKAFGGNASEEPEIEPIPNQCQGQSEKRNGKEQWKGKNPFKYDSSDEEDVEGTTAKPKNKKIQKEDDGPKNYFKQDLFKRDPLFFKKNDERLKGVFEQFLVTTENLTEVSQKFNESGRTELKAIAKSKWQNSKRKNEKKVKIMKLVRKKRRREAMKKEKNNSNK